MRTMYDSITAGDVPAGSELVAGYCDGDFRWSDADWALHAGKTLVRIATRAATDDGHVLDAEPGDATPEQAVGWVVMRRAAGADPTVYCDLSEWPAVRAAFVAAGVIEPHYWIAAYGRPPVIPDGAVAFQYANEPLTGGHYDASVVADFWEGVDVDEAQVKALIAEYGQALETNELLPLKQRIIDLETAAAGPVKPHGHTVTGSAT